MGRPPLHPRPDPILARPGRPMVHLSRPGSDVALCGAALHGIRTRQPLDCVVCASLHDAEHHDRQAAYGD